MATKNQTTVKGAPGTQELYIIREFEAPRELVFKAFTDPKILVRWGGPCGLTLKVEKLERGNGGVWRYLYVDPAGNLSGAFSGVCHEEKAPERIIRTFEFEGLPEKGHVALQTTKFEDLPGNRTRVIIQTVYQSVADRDATVQSGMERGVTESHEQLDVLLKELAK